jgi:uncharacterized protein with von Willebrand factor type A (vWA) domain
VIDCRHSECACHGESSAEIRRCLLLLAYGFLAAAQTAPTQTTRSLLVNALDRNGNAVRNLTKDSFRVKVNGHAAALLDAHYNLAPRRIVVLLDMSGSMAGETEKTRNGGLPEKRLKTS